MLDEGEVDRIVECPPVQTCECGAPVHAVAEEPLRHQVFDVPPVQAQVHGYRRYAGRCSGCGKSHRGALPAGVLSGQIGPQARLGLSAFASASFAQAVVRIHLVRVHRRVVAREVLAQAQRRVQG